MKTQVIARIDQNPEYAGEPRSTEPRPQPSKLIEHRHERRKIREQLRRVNWLLNAEDEIFA